MPNSLLIPIIADLNELYRERSTTHALELAECRAALAAAEVLLERKDERIEHLTDTIFKLLDQINNPT